MTFLPQVAVPASSRWARAALVIVAALLAYELAGRAAAGSVLPMLLVAGAAGAALLLSRPQWVAIALLVFAATVFRVRAGGLSLGGIRTDVVELMAFALVGYAVLSRVRGGRSDAVAVAPFALWTAGLAAGAVTGYVHGTSRSLLQGEAKTYLFVLIAPALAAVFAGPAGRARLERLVLLVCTAGSIVVLLLVATGRTITSGSPTALTTLGATSDVQRVRPALLGLLVVGILLQVARSAARGGTRPVLLIGLYSLVILLSYNRSTWLALLVCALACAHRVRDSRWRGRGWLRRMVLAAAVALMAFLAATHGALGEPGREVVARVNSTISPEVTSEGSYEERRVENEAAVRSLSDSPLTGVGLGQPYGARFAFYDPESRITLYGDRPYAHNTYLLVWLRLGVLGLVAVAWLVWRVLRSAQSIDAESDPHASRRRSAASWALASFALAAVFQPFVLSRPDLLAIAVCLVLIAPDHVRAAVGSASPSEPPRVRRT